MEAKIRPTIRPSVTALQVVSDAKLSVTAKRPHPARRITTSAGHPHTTGEGRPIATPCGRRGRGTTVLGCLSAPG
jgi:hypothetical protein